MAGARSVRTASAGLVIATHAAIVLAFLRVHHALPNVQEREVRMLLQPLDQTARGPRGRSEAPDRAPAAPEPSARRTGSITRPALPDSAPLRGLGEFLSCDAGDPSGWSDAQRRACMTSLGSRARGETAPLLGKAKPSPFDAVIAARNAPFRPAFQPCPDNMPGNNTGTNVCLGEHHEMSQYIEGVK